MSGEGPHFQNPCLPMDERLAAILTPEEMADPDVRDKVREGLVRMDREGREHEAAHAVVARLIGAQYLQHSWRSGEIKGTPWQTAIVAAAGPECDRLNGRYIRHSPEDREALEDPQGRGVDVHAASAVARSMLARHRDEVERQAIVPRS